MAPADASVCNQIRYNVTLTVSGYARGMTDEPYLSLPDVARQLGISRITLYTQVKRGLVRARKVGSRYKVRLSEARADRAANVMSDMRPRTGPTSRKSRCAKPQSDYKVFLPADDKEPDDGGNSDFARARARKEAALAEMRELDLLERKGELVDAATIQDAVFTRFRELRDAWLNWPARIGAVMAAELNVDGALVIVTLEKHVREQLTVLSRSTESFDIVRKT